jgi:integrase
VASIYRPNGRRNWIIEWVDENGRRRRKSGTSDRAVAQRIARDLENRKALRREGLVDPKEEAYAAHAARPLVEHLDAWEESLSAAGSTPDHVVLFTKRARRVVALLMGSPLAAIDPPSNAKRADHARFAARLAEWVSRADLSDLTVERAQRALATLRAKGRSLATCNHHRVAIKSFSKWCHDTHRTREDALRGLKGYNAKEDRRHDRRTIGLEELQRLIAVTENGPVAMGVTGPVRALCYRLAATTGLRHGEIASITAASFDWRAPSVTIRAAYTKNGDPATLTLPGDLADDLKSYVATLPAGARVFPLRRQKGAKMLRPDLEAAGIPYVDASGQFFDFHSLRCEMATLADQAGVSPRVVQKMMRHSTLELTGRYTRPRAADIAAAAARLPSLTPTGDRAEAVARTGTDGPIRGATAPPTAPREDADDSKPVSDKDLRPQPPGVLIR